MTHALEGIKVINMGTFGPSNFATHWLSDLGADVIMVEWPGNRAMPDGMREGGSSRATNSRDQRSIVLNLKTEEARMVLYRAVKDADVLIEANRPGVAKLLGFDYETLTAINPRLIYCSLTGYGQTGPYANMPGHCPVWEGIGGWLLMQGAGLANTGGDYTGRPFIDYYQMSDIKAGPNVAISVLAALYAREKMGTGQYLDLAIFDASIAVREPGAPPRGEGTFEMTRPQYNVYECKDGKYISTAANEKLQWSNLCEGLGVPELAGFITGVAEISSPDQQPEQQRNQEIRETFQRIFETKTRDEWFRHLTQWDTQIAKVNTIDEAKEDPQVKVRGMHVEVVGEGGHREIQYGTPFKLSKTPGRSVHRRAPKIGEDTDQVLAQLGYNKADIARLRQNGAAI